MESVTVFSKKSVEGPDLQNNGTPRASAPVTVDKLQGDALK